MCYQFCIRCGTFQPPRDDDCDCSEDYHGYCWDCTQKLLEEGHWNRVGQKRKFHPGFGDAIELKRRRVTKRRSGLDFKIATKFVTV